MYVEVLFGLFHNMPQQLMGCENRT